MPPLGLDVVFRQSNSEGAADRLDPRGRGRRRPGRFDRGRAEPEALTPTSIALRDAHRRRGSARRRVTHLSRTCTSVRRLEHISYISPVARGIMTGLGGRLPARHPRPAPAVPRETYACVTSYTSRYAMHPRAGKDEADIALRRGRRRHHGFRHRRGRGAQWLLGDRSRGDDAACSSTRERIAASAIRAVDAKLRQRTARRSRLTTLATNSWTTSPTATSSSRRSSRTSRRDQGLSGASRSRREAGRGPGEQHLVDTDHEAGGRDGHPGRAPSGSTSPTRSRSSARGGDPQPASSSRRSSAAQRSPGTSAAVCGLQGPGRVRRQRPVDPVPAGRSAWSSRGSPRGRHRHRDEGRLAHPMRSTRPGGPDRPRHNPAVAQSMYGGVQGAALRSRRRCCCGWSRRGCSAEDAVAALRLPLIVG